jgi:hypothetical protein
MTEPWTCLECTARQATAGACARCGEPDTLDLRSENTRELVRDMAERRRHRAETTARWIGVAVGLVVVFGAWLIPGYWSLRGWVYPGLPFLADQWLFMIVIGVVVMKIAQRVLRDRRFAELASELTS